eukprot:925600-Prymnesium_polylepis.1
MVAHDGLVSVGAHERGTHPPACSHAQCARAARSMCADLLLSFALVLAQCRRTFGHAAFLPRPHGQAFAPVLIRRQPSS